MLIARNNLFPIMCDRRDRHDDRHDDRPVIYNDASDRLHVNMLTFAMLEPYMYMNTNCCNLTYVHNMIVLSMLYILQT